jgi:mono/diheme cytochrome c family protein
MRWWWLHTTLLCAAAGNLGAQDVQRGAALYESHCVRCHREGLHDRQKSKVATYADLRLQVERWTQATGANLTRADREDLIEFLDASHYQLGRRPPAAKP